MSRIGKKIINVPAGTEVRISANTVFVKGPRGELKRNFPPVLSVELADGKIKVGVAKETKKSSALWGLTRSLIANMVEGVNSGFEKKLEFEGIGYKANLEGDTTLVMQLGFSHPVKLPAPEGIKFTLEKNTITVSGADKELVGEVASQVRSLKPPEPYKGKGIKYKGEVVRRKAGKKAVAAA